MHDLLTPEDVESVTHIPVRTLGQWRYLGTGPAYVKIGRHVRYQRADLEAWLDAHRVTPGVPA